MSRALPILFNTEMVKAILDGRKTVTRRIIHRGKSSPQYHGRDKFYGIVNHLNNDYKNWYAEFYNNNDVFEDSDGEEHIDGIYYKLPYKPGDILYVRETWQYLRELDGNEQTIEGSEKYYYAATDTLPFGAYVDSRGVTHDYIPWRPSIHMPKEAARIWLKVTDVRVERLQDITEEQAEKESGIDNRGFIHSPDNEYSHIHTALEDFRDNIWNSTIKKSDLDLYGWDANPWVWVIEFKRCEKPKEEIVE